MKTLLLVSQILNNSLAPQFLGDKNRLKLIFLHQNE
jgi:hypothetical protein